jgi:hypothetical protein
MTDYPDWLRTPDAAPDLDGIEVDWAALPDDWRQRNHRFRSGPPAAHANLVRAKVAEGLIDPSNLSFADYLDTLQERIERATEPPS